LPIYLSRFIAASSTTLPTAAAKRFPQELPPALRPLFFPKSFLQMEFLGLFTYAPLTPAALFFPSFSFIVRTSQTSSIGSGFLFTSLDLLSK